MFKSLLLPLIWFVRIPLRILMFLFLHIGSYVAASHGVLMLLELWSKGYGVIVDKDTLEGMAMNKTKTKFYYFNILKGDIHEVKVSKADAKSVVPDSTDDGVQD